MLLAAAVVVEDTVTADPPPPAAAPPPPPLEAAPPPPLDTAPPPLDAPAPLGTAPLLDFRGASSSSSVESDTFSASNTSSSPAASKDSLFVCPKKQFYNNDLSCLLPIRIKMFEYFLQ